MSKKNIVYLSVVFFMFLSGFNLFAVSCTTQIQENPQAKKQDSLSDIIKNGAFLVDVRSPGEYSNGHVTGSVNIPLVTIQDSIAQFKSKDNIVVFCQSGGRSSRAKNILEHNGITNVTNGGGWEVIRAIVEKKY